MKRKLRYGVLGASIVALLGLSGICVRAQAQDGTFEEVVAEAVSPGVAGEAMPLGAGGDDGDGAPAAALPASELEPMEDQSVTVGDYVLTLDGGGQPQLNTNYENGSTLTLFGPASITVTMKADTATSTTPIVIGKEEKDTPPTVTFVGVTTDLSKGSSNGAALTIAKAAKNAHLNVSGQNSLTSKGDYAGIDVSGSLTISTGGDATGFIGATAGSGDSAGIGGSKSATTKIDSIVISNHASVYAMSPSNDNDKGTAAGIGGASGQHVSTIVLSGDGTVTASANGATAAIGPGSGAKEGVSDITIAGPKVTASNDGSGPAIGAVGNTADVTLNTTSTITATTKGDGPALSGGGSESAATGKVSFNGGTVTVTSESGVGVEADDVTFGAGLDSFPTVVTVGGPQGAIKADVLSFGTGASEYRHVSYGNSEAATATTNVVEFTGMAPTLDPKTIFANNKWLKIQPFTPTSLRIIPPAVTLATGKSQQFALGISASAPTDFPTNQDLQTQLGATWTLSGNESPLTTISNTGLLAVGGDETRAHLTVTGTASQGWQSAWPAISPSAASIVSVTMPVPVTGITVSPHEATIRVGETVQLNAILAPPSATDQLVVWGSEDDAVATVDEKGLVTGVAPGTVAVTAISDDGWFTDEATITVLPASVPPAPETPSLVPRTGEQMLTIAAIIAGVAVCAGIVGFVLARNRKRKDR